jgi:hypothetical protein
MPMVFPEAAVSQGDQIGQFSAHWAIFGCTLGFLKMKLPKEMLTLWNIFC